VRHFSYHTNYSLITLTVTHRRQILLSITVGAQGDKCSRTESLQLLLKNHFQFFHR